MTTPNQTYPRGWGSPGASRKAHYFIEYRSLCRKWMYMGDIEDVDTKSKDDCTECTRRLAKLRAANEV